MTGVAARGSSRASTRIPQAGPHGGDGAIVAAALGIDPGDVLDLSASLNPFAPDVASLLERHLGSVARYPDPGPATAALAERLGVGRAKVLLTNGGAEAIALVGAETEVGWVENPDFSLYARHLRRLDRSGPLWRSNPRNPTGELAPGVATAGVWDEAFYPLSTGRWTRGDSGCVVVGSLTKLLACPGLRVGYVVGGEELVGRLARRQPMWAVGGLAAASLPQLLEMVDLQGWAAGLRALRADLVSLLSRHGLTARPSDASYVLVDGAHGLREELAREAVVVRDCSSFGLPDSVRIAVPSEAGLERLDAALDRAVGSAARVTS